MVAVAVLATPLLRRTVPMTALLCALYLWLTAVAASRRLDASSSSTGAASTPPALGSTTTAKASTAAAWGGGGRHRQAAHHTHAQQHTQPIRVGLSIDDYSLRDFMIVMASVLAAAEHPNRVIFHLVACAKDMEAARALQQQVGFNVGVPLRAALGL